MDRSPVEEPRFRLKTLFWVGLGVLVLGVAPLALTLVFAKLGWTGDPNPNPVGLGILAFITFWPGVILVLVGLAQSIAVHAAARRDAARRGVGTALPDDPR